MKLLIMITAPVLLLPLSLLAGDKVGNGGGIWACQNSSSILKAELVDLYEAKEEYGLGISEEALDPFQNADKKLQLLNSFIPSYANLWMPYFNVVKANIHFVNAILTPIDDALYHISPLPSSCPEGNWSYVQFANFTDQGRILVRQDLWQTTSLSSASKAALLWHETLYWWLREKKGDKNSIRARRLVGILFSNLSPQEMLAQFEKVLGSSLSPSPTNLWICMTQSFSSNDVFSASAKSRREAEVLTFQACQNSGRNACNEGGISCDQILSESEDYFCEIHDFSLGQIFSAHGRSQIEGKFKALSTCNAAPRYGSGNCDENRVSCQKN